MDKATRPISDCRFDYRSDRPCCQSVLGQNIEYHGSFEALLSAVCKCVGECDCNNKALLDLVEGGKTHYKKTSI